MTAILAKRLAVMALALGGAVAARADVIDDYLALQLGSWSSAAQAAADPAYGTAVWHLVEMPWTAQPGRWLYVESWMMGTDRPYLQRISRLLTRADGAIVATRYTLPEPGRFVGGWRNPALFAALSPADLTELAGCDAVITRAGKQRSEGTTSGASCPNSYKGAAYAISRLVLSEDGMENWDRGFAADGELRWGPAGGGYRFRRMQPAQLCLTPAGAPLPDAHCESRAPAPPDLAD